MWKKKFQLKQGHPKIKTIEKTFLWTPESENLLKIFWRVFQKFYRKRVWKRYRLQKFLTNFSIKNFFGWVWEKFKGEKIRKNYWASKDIKYFLIKASPNKILIFETKLLEFFFITHIDRKKDNKKEKNFFRFSSKMNKNNFSWKSWNFFKKRKAKKRNFFLPMISFLWIYLQSQSFSQ